MAETEDGSPITEDVPLNRTFPSQTTTQIDLPVKYATNLDMLHYNTIFALTMPINMNLPNLFQPTTLPPQSSQTPLGILTVQLPIT